ncbi:hypothetical protein FRUB_06711 [Fimbriiglobus ruber]|uniref:Uncharacterized protein n=1 Tax=Fimbriiglobus ruber TaxID=1908690 RepID=A0A225D7Q3_9BACT|nr:hypothetical protein FRUB_06711 [Fimbriiglobus ruber]
MTSWAITRRIRCRGNERTLRGGRGFIRGRFFFPERLPHPRFVCFDDYVVLTLPGSVRMNRTPAV